MRSLVVLVLLALAVFAVPAFAQEPEPEPEGPGQEQPGDPGADPAPQPQPVPPSEPAPPSEAPAPGGELPRTGIEAFQLAFLGIVLLLGGARLRVIALRRRRRVSAPNHPQRDEWTFPDPEVPAPTGLLPSTAGARRLARAGGDRLDVDRGDLVGVASEGLDERPAGG